MAESKHEKIIDKNYGSIPHMLTSKINQQADKKISQGQEDILTKKPRDWKDLVIVTEKVDGSNCGIIKKNGKLIPITRSGYDVVYSRFKQHHLFGEWLRTQNNFMWLPEDWRICGDWMAQVHGTKYDITSLSPFCAFDIFNERNERILFLNFFSICSRYEINMVNLIHIGQPVSIKNALMLNKHPYGNPDIPEGLVYRVEREGRVDFLAKWVHARKEDGKYMREEIMNVGFRI